MSGQSSGSSAPSASGVQRIADGTHSLRHDQATEESDIDATVNANLVQNDPLQRRHRPRSSGGFLLHTGPTHCSETRSSTHSEPDTTRDVKGKRKAGEGDLIVPKRASARQRHRQKHSLGGSPLATELISVHSSEHTDINGHTQRDKRSSVQSTTRQSMRSSFNSNGTSTGSATSMDPATMSNGRSAIGHDTNPAEIVNLALNLSESRRRNFSSGGLLIHRDVVGARRIMSSGQQTLLPNSASGGSLRQHLQYQRQISRNVSPRSGKSGKSGRSSNSKESGFDSPHSQKEQVGRQSTLLPGVNAGISDDVVFDASDATIARAEKARVAIELMYEYRRLLQYLPPIPTNSKRKSAMSKGTPKHQSDSSTGLGRLYNPLQYIRNRKVRFRQRRPLDAETAGWKDLDRVRTWVDIVASEREDGLSRIDRPFPLPSLDTISGGYPLADGSQSSSVSISAGSQTKKVGRPRMDWDFTSWDLLADAYWLALDDNIDLIEDSAGKKITTDHLSRKDYTPKASIESNRSSVRRSGSIVREHASPNRVRALAGHARKDSKDRGRRSLDVHEPRSPRLEDNGSQDRKSRWPKRLVRSRSSSDSDGSHLESRSKKNRGRDNLETAALEKQMMDMLAKEAEASRRGDQTSDEDTDTKVKPNSKHHDGDMRYIVDRRDNKSRPNGPQRMRTDIPVAVKHPVSARASLDEERFHHRRMSSDELDLTTPNSPVAPGLVPSIAINLSPPASPPSASASPRKTLISRGGSSQRDRSRSVNRRTIGESDPDSSGTTGLPLQTTNESQLVNMLRKEKSTGFRNGLLTPVKSEATGNTYRPLDGSSIRSIKNVNGSDSRFRGLFKGGRIAELVGSEVSRVGDMFWRKDTNYNSRVASPASSYAPSEESDFDDDDTSGLDNSPKNDLFRATTKDGGSLSKVSTISEKPRYYMSNLPTFRSSFNREEQSPESTKASPDHDHISRQQLAQRERGRSSRFDRLAPPKIDMSGISIPSSREPSPNRSQTRRAHDEDSRQSSSSRSDRRVRSADRRLNAMLGIPGQVRTGRAPRTGLAGLESRPRESPQRPELEGKRQWSITDRGLSSVSGTVDKRDIARVRALLLSSGVKANEIARRAEEIPDRPTPFLQGLQGMFKGPIPHVPRSQEPLLAARMLISNIETSTQRLRDDADHFIHTTIEELHDQIKAIDQHVTYKLIPLVRNSADGADTFSTELTTTHTLAIKQLNDSVDYILRRRRRRLRNPNNPRAGKFSDSFQLEFFLPARVRRAHDASSGSASCQAIGPKTNWAKMQSSMARNAPGKRSFADRGGVDANTKPSIHDSDAIVLPGSQSTTATKPQPPPPGPILSASPAQPSPAAPTSDTSVPPQNVPLVPPSPPGGKIQTAPPTSVPPGAGAAPIPPTTPPSGKPARTTPPPPPPPPSPPPPPPPRRRSRWIRNTFSFLILATALGFAGGTFYSLRSDNFHDFFTEYIPFGEDAVLYFEEREFRKRFPTLTNPTNRPTPASGNKITIPSKSGVSWKVAGEDHQGSDLQTKGRHMSALDANDGGVKIGVEGKEPSAGTGPKKTKAVEKAKKDAAPTPKTPPPSEKPKAEKAPPKAPPPIESKPPAPALPPKPTMSSKDASQRPPEVNEPSRFMPMESIDPLKIKNANEPLVQDLVKIVNDIITVVNADGASHKYNSTISKAKAALANVGARIMSLKEAETRSAEEKIKSTQIEFDTAAKELVRRLEEEMRDQDGKWKSEFESEREKIVQSYQDRLQTESQQAQQLSEQRLRNELLEQAITMKKQFINEVTDRVETERNGRLSKLSDLSSSVTELEKLTADWNSVIDANLKTQHLQVAVEAVRSSLETADRPRPFLRELAALKEIASDDPVINAAIASINPTAYQRGIPTTAQLIERFRRVAAEVRKASLLPEDAGVASHAASFLLSKFMFKKKGMTIGDDVESILTRTETLLEEGNLDKAAREMNTLDGWAKTLSWDWLSECRRVLEVRQAMDVMSTEARLEGLKVD